MGTLSGGVSIVVTVLDQAESIESFHRHLAAVLPTLDQPYEIVYVDDGSRDGSWEILQGLATREAGVVGVRLRRSFGQAAAIAAGFAHARYGIVVTLDADLQDDPADIPRLVAVLIDGNYDIVAAWRRDRGDRPLTCLLAPSLVASRLIN